MRNSFRPEARFRSVTVADADFARCVFVCLFVCSDCHDGYSIVVVVVVVVDCLSFDGIHVYACEAVWLVVRVVVVVVIVIVNVIVVRRNNDIETLRPKRAPTTRPAVIVHSSGLSKRQPMTEERPAHVNVIDNLVEASKERRDWPGASQL